MVIEYAQAQGVTPFVIVPSIVYGRGTGAWNQLSVMVPGLTQASLKLWKSLQIRREYCKAL
ncbi:hypothetical protein NW760_009419 [Fusarium oxysporum]|nr:hypothetical protein NW769_003369 [Fusarium oxysporum]KAJ4224950.1 hypothetical protein NW760_009419 [Fusarium oxysporum]